MLYAGTADIGCVTDRGKCREENQDSLIVRPDLGLYVVLDGMGGHARKETDPKTGKETMVGGSAASTRAKEVIESCFVPSRLESLDEAVEMANDAICKQLNYDNTPDYKKNQERVGTTVTAVAVDYEKGVARLVHVGDSKAYLIRGEKIELKSVDQTVIAENMQNGLNMGKMLSSPFNVKNYQSDGVVDLSSMITQYVGQKDHLNMYVVQFDIIPGDILVLCSDGLSDRVQLADEISYNVQLARHMVKKGGAEVTDASQVSKILGATTTEELIETSVIRDAFKNDAPQNACKNLAKMANDRGGDDNITIIAVKFKQTD